MYIYIYRLAELSSVTNQQVFYKNAAKAKSFIQASPVDEDPSLESLVSYLLLLSLLLLLSFL
jgi:hypothetical protein